MSFSHRWDSIEWNLSRWVTVPVTEYYEDLEFFRGESNYMGGADGQSG